MSLYSKGKRLYFRKDVEIILKRILIKNNTVKIVVYFKSPFFSYIPETKLYAKKNDKIYELEKKEASAGYYKAKEKTDTFWQLIYETEIVEYTTLDFFVELDGVECPTVYYNCDTTAFLKGLRINMRQILFLSSKQKMGLYSVLLTVLKNTACQ